MFQTGDSKFLFFFSNVSHSFFNALYHVGKTESSSEEKHPRITAGRVEALSKGQDKEVG